MSDQSKQPKDAVAKALLAILEAIEAQAPVITDNGMVNVVASEWNHADPMYGHAILRLLDAAGIDAGVPA